MTGLVVAAAIIRTDGSLLAARRVGKHAGFWELPGGQVEPGESPTEALRREVHEELGVDISVGNEIGSGFAIDDVRTLHVYLSTLIDENVALVLDGSHDETRWLEPGEWLDLNWLSADREAVITLRIAED